MDSRDWNERYRERELVWSAEPNLFLPPIIAYLPIGSALDLACGEGRNSIWLKSLGWDVTGVDFSDVAIKKAAEIAGDRDVTWIVDDITTYEPDRRFDLVLFIYVHLDPEGVTSLFKNAIDALLPGGTLISLGHAIRNLTDGVGGPQDREILWSVEKIAPHVRNLDVVSFGEILRPVEGSEIDAIDVLLHATKPVE